MMKIEPKTIFMVNIEPNKVDAVIIQDISYIEKLRLFQVLYESLMKLENELEHVINQKPKMKS